MRDAPRAASSVQRPAAPSTTRVGSTSPPSTCRSVVLPEPERPSSATLSSARPSRSTPASASHDRVAAPYDDLDAATDARCTVTATLPSTYLDHAVGRRGDARRVSDDDDRAAEFVAADARAPRARPARSPRRARRSARRRARAAPRAPPRRRSRPAAARRPRASRRAARCRPRRPNASSAPLGGVPTRAPPGEPQRERDVLARRERRPEVAALEDDRHVARAVAGEARARRAASSERPNARTSPADGWSSPAAR